MNEEELIEIIRQYEYVPRIIMERLFCTSQYDYVNNTIIKYLNRRLKQLAVDKYISYRAEDDAYCVPLFSGKINRDRLKALWVLTQFEGVTRHYAGKDFIQVVFIAKGTLYEIVSLSSKTYRIAVTAINQNTDKKNMPKRIVIVENEDEANLIGNSVLQEINCVALCTVSNDGVIESYDI